MLVFIFAALVGAILWNLLTWWWGLPSSSSHALAGGMIGAGLVALGPGGLIGAGILQDRPLHRPLAPHRHGARLR